MLHETMNLLPGVTIGKILIQRDETTRDKRAVFTYLKLPDDVTKKERVFILDPMLGTGGSSILCIDKVIA